MSLNNDKMVPKIKKVFTLQKTIQLTDKTICLLQGMDYLYYCYILFTLLLRCEECGCQQETIYLALQIDSK